MSKLKDLMEKRRSAYVVGKDTDLTPEEITDAVTETALHVPTAFNAQSHRLAVVYGEVNDKVWDIIYDSAQSFVDPEQLKEMEAVYKNPKNGIGTILFFEDRDAVEANIPANEERSQVYKLDGSANSQLTAWLTLTELGLGATLQHHNIGYEHGFDKAFRELLDLPESYELVAEMPFGSVEQDFSEQASLTGDKLVKSFQ